jgi:hypothetical protein
LASNRNQLWELERQIDEITQQRDQLMSECARMRVELEEKLRRPSTSDSGEQTEAAVYAEQTIQTESGYATTTDCQTQTLRAITTERECSAQVDMRPAQCQTDDDTGASTLVVTSCVRCTSIQTNLAVIDQLLAMDASALSPIGESGVEDVGSSAESLDLTEPSASSGLNQSSSRSQQQHSLDGTRLRHRCRVARQHLAEMNMSLSVQHSQQTRLNAQTQVENTKPVTALPTRSASTNDIPSVRMMQLQSDNDLLQRRLIETRSLLDETVAQYRRQLRETARLGDLLQQLSVLDAAYTP